MTRLDTASAVLLAFLAANAAWAGCGPPECDFQPPQNQCFYWICTGDHVSDLDGALGTVVGFTEDETPAALVKYDRTDVDALPVPVQRLILR